MVIPAQNGQPQGVARASLGELLLDYEDFLRQRKLRQWAKDDPEALLVRGKFKLGEPDGSDKSKVYCFNDLTPEAMANTMICLVNQASYLLWQQMKFLEKEFMAKGGFTERMYNMRKKMKR